MQHPVYEGQNIKNTATTQLPVGLCFIKINSMNLIVVSVTSSLFVLI